MQVGLIAHPFFVDHQTLLETVKAIGLGGWVRRVMGQQMRKAEARGRRRLEPAIAPAAVEIEPVDMGAVDDRRSVHRHIHDPAPHPQQSRAPDMRKDRHAAFADVLDHGQIAALGVGVIAVDIAAEHKAALVGLAAHKSGPRQRSQHPA